MTCYIYCLKCPVTGLPRYVGKTLNPRKRLSAHISKARTHQVAHHCSEWIRSLLSIGQKPALEIIFEVPETESWQGHEKRLIDEYRSAGFPLTNLTGGGEGFYEPNPDLLKRRGDALREAFSDPGFRIRRSELAKLTSAKPEVKAARAQGAISAWSDPAKKERMLAGMRTPEAIARRSAATKARNADPTFAAHHAAKMKVAFTDPARKEQLRLAGEKRWRDHRTRKSE